MSHIAQPYRKQQGVVLLVGLIFLIIMTLIGVTGMQSTVIEQRMSTNAQDRSLAFEAAEAALRAAENTIESYASATPGPDTNASDGIYCKATACTTTSTWTPTGGDYAADDTWLSASTEVTAIPADWNVTSNPEYIIEYFGQRGGGSGTSGGGLGGGVELGVSAPVGTTGAAPLYRITARGFGANDNTRVILQVHYGRSCDFGSACP